MIPVLNDDHTCHTSTGNGVPVKSSAKLAAPARLLAISRSRGPICVCWMKRRQYSESSYDVSVNLAPKRCEKGYPPAQRRRRV